jgi:hypothetical protein
MGQGSGPSNKRLSGRAGIKYYISCLGLSKVFIFSGPIVAGSFGILQVEG